jgi:phage repressor protein C with HTH and peptisase S24 domain
MSGVAEVSDQDEEGPIGDDGEPISDAAVAARAVRLREAVRAAGGNASVASRASMHVGTLNRYLAGRDMKAQNLVGLAAATGVRLEWLATGEGPRHASEAGFMEAGGELAGYDDAVVTVRPLEGAPPSGIAELVFLSAWLEREVGRAPEGLALVRAVGDAMAPGIRDGDVVMVDCSALELGSGRLYLVDLAGELQLRRIQRRLTGSMLLICDNERYPPEEVRPSDPPLRIVGEVVWHGRVV